MASNQDLTHGAEWLPPHIDAKILESDFNSQPMMILMTMYS
jgi:hypothetical protein